MASSPSLLDSELYLTQLQRLRLKSAHSRGRREPQSEGVGLSSVLLRGADLCDRIAREIRTGSFRFTPLDRSVTIKDGKRRTIHRPDLVDSLVLGALAQRLTTLLEPILGDSVFGYRPGRNSQLATTKVRECLAHHRDSLTDRRQHGLYVLQRDLASYGESIPTDAGSALWPLLDEVLARLSNSAEAEVIRSLVRAACRPSVRDRSGEVSQMEHGIPTGSPIQQPLANLYLLPLDRELAASTPHFYARFGDDLLFMTPDDAEVLRADETLARVVDDLRLTFNPEKTRNLYFTGPGRPCGTACVKHFHGTSHIEYLGVRLSFAGHLGLKRKRQRQFLRRCRLRIGNTLGAAPAEHAVHAVAGALSQAIHGRSALTDPTSFALRTWVDDRQQVRQLDHLIAMLCAQAISGKRGVRAFRQVRRQALRDSGLLSLLELRRRSKGRP